MSIKFVRTAIQLRFLVHKCKKVCAWLVDVACGCSRFVVIHCWTKCHITHVCVTVRLEV